MRTVYELDIIRENRFAVPTSGVVVSVDTFLHRLSDIPTGIVSAGSSKNDPTAT